MHLFTETIEGLKIAWDAIRANKLRSVLTTLGIVIGIVTVTLMGTAIDALHRSFQQTMSIFGANTLHVSRFSWASMSHEEWHKAAKRRPITPQQARLVENQMLLASAVAPVTGMSQPVRYKNRSSSGVRIIGTTDQFLSTSGFSIGTGRFLSADEAGGGRPVCVIGTDVATNLFRLESPLGKHLRIGPRSLEVIGVLNKQGSFLGLQSFDNQVIIPLRQLLLAYWREPDVEIWVTVGQKDQLDNAIEELHGLMRKIRRLAPGEQDDFAINQQEQLLRRFNKVAGIIAMVGFLITGLALFVGGIGIMNIMFVSVAERTREIGVRKAIGAKRRTILLQFLLEAASICLLGGLLGLGVTWLATLAISNYFPMTISLPVMGLAILVSLITGLASGFFPAWRAARLDPVEALRSE